MLVTGTPVLVLRRDTYTSPEDAQKYVDSGQHDRVVRWRDSGALIEFVELYDSETGSIIRATVDESGCDAEQGALIEPVLDLRVEQVGRTSRQGRDYVDSKTKFRLVSAKTLGAPVSVKAAA